MTKDEMRSDAGFSLVEILVVLSVIGLMSGLMLALMGQFRHLTAADQRVSAQMALQKSVDHIAGLLERAAMLPLDFRPGSPARFLQGSENAVRFLAVAKTGSATFDLREISIALEKAGEAGRIVETHAPRRFERRSIDETHFDLALDAQRLSFAFLEPANSTSIKPVWRKDWLLEGMLPLAIRISLTAKTRSGQSGTVSAVALLGQ